MTEEGNAPIQDPMELGEMANWTPLDGSEGLKRKRAESIEVTESDTEHWLGTDNTLSEAIEVITEIANGEYKSQTLRQDILSTKEAYLGVAYPRETFAAERECNVCDSDSQSFCGKCRNHKGSCCRCVGSSDWEEMQREYPEIEYRAESPSATIPVNEPSWVKPVATALGFALGFFGIHELKKVL